MVARDLRPDCTAIRRARAEAVHAYLGGLGGGPVLYRAVLSRFIGIFPGRGWGCWSSVEVDGALDDLAAAGLVEITGRASGEIFIALTGTDEPAGVRP